MRLFGLAAFFRDAYQSQWRPNMMEVWRRRREHRLFVVVVVVVTGVTVASAFCYLGYRAATGRTTVGDLAIGGLAVRALLQALRADDDDLRMGFGSKAAAEAFAFPVVASPAGPVPAGPGKDTVMSSGYAGGVDASGGEWQRIAIAISHRFATVRKAERVVVLDHGQLIEDGTHEDLITAGGRYAELFRLQAKRFQEAPS